MITLIVTTYAVERTEAKKEKNRGVSEGYIETSHSTDGEDGSYFLDNLSGLDGVVNYVEFLNTLGSFPQPNCMHRKQNSRREAQKANRGSRVL